MLKPKFLCIFQCLRLKTKLVRKAIDVSCSVVLVTTLVNIAKKVRKTMFSKSLCLPSKVYEFFFFPCILVFFWQETCMCEGFDQTSDVCGINAMLTFLYMVSIVLDKLYCNLWSLNQLIVQQKV